jgi:hypothetical protein
MLLGPRGSLGPGIRKEAERREKREGEGKVQMHGSRRKEAVATMAYNLRLHRQS